MKKKKKGYLGVEVQWIGNAVGMRKVICMGAGGPYDLGQSGI